MSAHRQNHAHDHAHDHAHGHHHAGDAPAALRLRNLTLGYDRRPAVHHVSGAFAPGSLTAVVGPNGAGKSTLLKAIIGDLPPLEGRIEWAAPGQAGARGAIAYLPQAADIDRSFPIGVYDLVAMGLYRRRGLFGGLGKQDRQTIAQALEAVGLAGFERRAIGTLSGGQMQRALFARVLVQDCDLILLDEPLTAIDTRTASDLIDIVRRWHAEKRTIITVLHDMDVVREVFPQTLLLAREAIGWGATRDVLTPENLLKARRMIEAHDAFAPVCHRDAA